jgi:hypothetical protein
VRVSLNYFKNLGFVLFPTFEHKRSLSLSPLYVLSWEVSSCAMESLYDIDLISEKIPVILDDSETWHIMLSTSMKLKERGSAHVYGANRHELNDSSDFTNLLLINRTASPLAW